MQAQPVLEVISNRLIYRNLSLGLPADNHKLGLAVEGGGMRGILSIGMLLALKDLDMLDIFDIYTGTSAGALNLAYVLAGQTAVGISAYLEDMTNPRNLRIRRAFNDEHPVMDLRNIYLELGHNKHLKLEKLHDYASNFYVAVNNITTGQGELVTPKQAGHRLFEYLIAGATLPFIAGEPWKIHNQDYYDGGLFYVNPYQAAEELDCTHVLVLNTTYQGFTLKPYGKLTERIFKRLDEQYRGAGTNYMHRLEEYCAVFSKLPYGETDVNDIRLYRHALATKSEVGRLTTDRAKLVEGMRTGYQSILDLFYPAGKAGLIPTMM